MPGNHLISGVSESDWSVICHSHRLKNANSNCFFVLPLPLFPFLTVFLSPSITCVWQVSNGWRGENNVLCTTLQLSAWLRLLLLSEPWGGLPAALFAPLSPSALKPPNPPPAPSPSHPPKESIPQQRHTNDPVRSMHHSTVHHHQQRLAMWLRRRVMEER